MTLCDGLAHDFDSRSSGGAEDNQFHRVSAAASARGEVHSRTSTLAPYCRPGWMRAMSTACSLLGESKKTMVAGFGPLDPLRETTWLSSRAKDARVPPKFRGSR